MTSGLPPAAVRTAIPSAIKRNTAGRARARGSRPPARRRRSGRAADQAHGEGGELGAVAALERAGDCEDGHRDPGRGSEEERRGEEPERRRAQDALGAGRAGPPRRVGRRGCGAQREYVERDRDRSEDCREHQQRVAPAVRVDQCLGEREEDERGERGDQREGGHRASALGGVREPLRENDEGRLVEDRGHREAKPGPDEVERGQPIDVRPRNDEQGCGDRPGAHQAPRAVSIEVAADGDAGGAGDEQRE